MAEQHGPVEHQFATLEQQQEAALLGMWLFLVTEVMLFGGLFTAYTLYRTKYPEAFHDASTLLNPWLGGLNTVVLITSSLTMVMAHHAAVHRRRKPLVGFLLLTILLGSAFVGIKAVEYREKWVKGQVPPLTEHKRLELEQQFEAERAQQVAGQTAANRAPPARGVDARHMELFLGLYFVMTGLHAAHMAIGLAALLVLVALAAARRLEANPMPVEVTGLYWHFVDIVWIFLFPLLYLIGLH